MMDRRQSKARAPRRHRTAAWMVGAAGLWLVSLLATAMYATAKPVVPAQDPAEDAFWKVCSDCHDPDRIRETRRTRGGWEDVIYQMIDKGAIGTNNDFELVLQYLVGHFGMVNVNQAEAAEIALVTGLSSKEADTVVAYRKENGNFKNFEALVKVPGIDVQKLELHRPAILF